MSRNKYSEAGLVFHRVFGPWGWLQIGKLTWLDDSACSELELMRQVVAANISRPSNA